MKISSLCTILLFTCCYAYGQNLIGYSDMEIRKFMKENRKDMNIDNVKNSLYSYLKYSDNTDMQTILFFLTPESVCRSVRVVCNTALKSEKIKELDSAYARVGDGKWIDNHDGKNYLISFREEKWSCTITFEPDK
jgi:hypothetical protein